MNKDTTLMHAITFVLLVSACGACGKSGGKDADVPQSDEAVGAVIPPSPFTMSLNLDVSGSGTDLDALSKLSTFESLTSSNSNHLQAMIYISAVDSNIAQPLKLPINLLKSAAGKNPVQSESDTWVYSYDVLENNRVWTANLTATRISTSATSWTMKVTSVPSDINSCCNEFLLFEGQSSSTGSGGWQVYDVTKSKESVKLFSIVYDYKSPNDKVLKFTINGNSLQNRLGMNSSGRYSADGDLRSLEVDDSSDQGKRQIKWNSESKEGAYIDPQNNVVCWDSYVLNFADVVCK